MAHSFLALLLLTASLSARTEGEEPESRPNVLLVVADDLATRLGCYGDPQAKTPHMDRLAGAGLRFEHAYAQGVTCNPSRTSFLSGLRPGTTGIFENRNWRELDLLTLPEHFSAGGYETLKVGKLFHPVRDRNLGRKREPTRRRRLWDRTLAPRAAEGDEESEGEDASDPLPEAADGAPDSREEGAALEGDPNFLTASGRVAWSARDAPALHGHDGDVARAAAAFLRGAGERETPFLLAVGFTKPHLPFSAPATWFERFDPADLELPEAPAPGPEDSPLPTPEEHREALRAYYACVAYIDACLGEILSALEDSGLRDRTIVVVTSDHGQFLGEHNLWRKGDLVEEGLHVPLLIDVPGAPGGVSSAALVELVDLMPTLSDLCGLPVPESLEGRSLRPLLEEPGRPWARAAFSYDRKAVSLRTARWRYTLDGDGGRTLFDTGSAPLERVNLADAPEHAAALAELEALLTGGWRAAGPPR